MVTPGLYGFVGATKWLTKLTATTYAAEQGLLDRARLGHRRHRQDPGPDRHPGRAGDRTGPGKVAIGGVAWAQGRGIKEVEVRVDDGPWQKATLGPDGGIDYWRQWYLGVGRHERPARPDGPRDRRHTARCRPTSGPTRSPAARPAGTRSSSSSPDRAPLLPRGPRPLRWQGAVAVSMMARRDVLENCCASKPIHLVGRGRIPGVRQSTTRSHIMRLARRSTIRCPRLALPLSLAACGTPVPTRRGLASRPRCRARSSSSAPRAPPTTWPPSRSAPAAPRSPRTARARSPAWPPTRSPPPRATTRVLSTLVTAVGEAGLGETLNSAKDITVFAPSNDAFAALSRRPRWTPR